MAQDKPVVLYPTPTETEALDRAYAQERAPMVSEQAANKTKPLCRGELSKQTIKSKRIVVRIMSLMVTTAIAVLLVSSAPTAAPTASAQEVAAAPNFVFILTDDLDERSMQRLGGIRALMGSEGITFKNAYVTWSLCCPSRASILRGQYPHNHAITSNVPPGGGHAKFQQLGLDQSTIATWLDDAGYRTAYLGKYLNGYGKSDLYIPPGYDEWFVMRYPLEDKQVNDNGLNTTIQGNSTDVLADEATDFIQRSATNSPDEPFFVTIGTKAPHEPPEVAARHQNRFVDVPLPRPPNFNEADLSDKPQWLQSYRLLNQTEIDSIQQLYRDRLRSMLAVEDLIRQVLATLNDTGELENTYVFFTSDNGYHMGNHRLKPEKRKPYEEDIGVPLMVRGPGVPAGVTRSQLVINNDFAPTLADLANVPTPAFVDGSSFAPLLTGSPPAGWRTAFLEEGWPLHEGELETGQIPQHKGVHTRTRMFVEYETGEHELYDLSVDPYQLESKPLSGNEVLYSTLERRLEKLRACAGEGCRTAEFGTAN